MRHQVENPCPQVIQKSNDVNWNQLGLKDETKLNPAFLAKKEKNANSWQKVKNNAILCANTVFSCNLRTAPADVVDYVDAAFFQPISWRSLIAQKIASPFALQSIFPGRSIFPYPPSSSFSQRKITLRRLNCSLKSHPEVGQMFVPLDSPESRLKI